jgi:hypothetical protein
MNQAVPKRLASSLIRRRSCQSAAGYCRAPILLLQIAVTRGIFKSHRALRTPTNASSALAEAQPQRRGYLPCAFI